MARVEVDYRDYFKPIAEALRAEGLLLVSVGKDGKPNAMTIGWGTLGPVWGRPMFAALVRPSRHTYGLIEESGDFTVNLMPKSLASALDYCGSRSGREVDKLAELGLRTVSSRSVRSPGLEQAALTLECRVVQKTDLVPEWLDPEIQRSAYSKGDHHRVYFGQILATYADPELLRSS